MLHDVSDKWLEEHGIGRKELDAHQIGRYSKDGVSDVQAACKDLPQPWQKSVVTRWAKQRDGLLVRHHPCPGFDLEPIFPQLRPDRYGEGDDGKIETGEIRRHKAHRDLRGWAYHIARHPDHGNLSLTDAQVDALPDAELHRLLVAGVVRGNRDHIHRKRAGYLHPPAPKKTIVHDHAVAFKGKPKMLASHLRDRRSKHKGIDVASDHEHRIRDKSVKYATRIDVSPLITTEMLGAAETFYFVIEGTIKNLAVLTWVRENGENAVVISVPAVGQWKAPELPAIIDRCMRGDLCMIVADADAHTKSEVMRQAIRCRRYLRDRDVDAHILLPPEDCLSGEKVGPDDALGKAGVPLHDFLVIHKEAGYQNTIGRAISETWTGGHKDSRGSTARTLPGRNWPGRVRNLKALIALIEQSDSESGQFWGSVRGLGEDLGMSSSSTAHAAIGQLVEYGFVALEEGSLDKEESEYSFDEVWRDKPTLRIDERLRATQTQQRYGDFLEERKENDGHNGSAPGAGVSRTLRNGAENPASLPD